MVHFPEAAGFRGSFESGFSPKNWLLAVGSEGYKNGSFHSLHPTQGPSACQELTLPKVPRLFFPHIFSSPAFNADQLTLWGFTVQIYEEKNLVNLAHLSIAKWFVGHRSNLGQTTGWVEVGCWGDLKNQIAPNT